MFYLQFWFKTKLKSILTFNKLTNINQVTLYNLQLAKSSVSKYTPKQNSLDSQELSNILLHFELSWTHLIMKK
jgi:hypothetical protein